MPYTGKSGLPRVTYPLESSRLSLPEESYSLGYSSVTRVRAWYAGRPDGSQPSRNPARWCTPGASVPLTGEGKKTKMSGSSLALQQVQRSTRLKSQPILKFYGVETEREILSLKTTLLRAKCLWVRPLSRCTVESCCLDEGVCEL